jgi:hypothetical protein
MKLRSVCAAIVATITLAPDVCASVFVQIDQGFSAWTVLHAHGENQSADFPTDDFDFTRTTLNGDEALFRFASEAFSGTAAGVEISLDTKLALSGDSPSPDGARAAMQVAHYLIAYSDTGRVLNPGSAQTTISFVVHGELVPGDSAYMNVGGGVTLYGPGTGVLGSEAIWNIDTPGPFTRELHFVSDIWHPGHQNAYVFSVGISWEIMRGPDTSGDSWIGFTDPGITTRFVSASVPAPASIGIWLFGTCAALIKRRNLLRLSSM